VRKLAETRPSTSILDILLPWRWNWKTFGYAGAVAAAVFVFFIGKSMIEKDKDILQPRPSIQAMSEQKADMDTSRHGIAQERETSTGETGVRAKPTDNVSIESGEVASDAYKSAEANSEIADRQTSPAAEGGNATATEEQALKEEPTTSVDMTPQEPRSAKIESLGKSAGNLDRALSLKMNTETEAVQPDTSYVVEIQPSPDRTESTTDMMALKAPSDFDSGAIPLEYIQNMDEVDIRNRLSAIALKMSDSLYSSQSLPEFATLKYSLAVKTRDSNDIYDAMNTIDTLLILNPRIAGKNAWLERRSRLRGLTPSRP